MVGYMKPCFQCSCPRWHQSTQGMSVPMGTRTPLRPASPQTPGAAWGRQKALKSGQGEDGGFAHGSWRSQPPPSLRSAGCQQAAGDGWGEELLIMQAAGSGPRAVGGLPVPSRPFWSRPIPSHPIPSRPHPHPIPVPIPVPIPTSSTRVQAVSTSLPPTHGHKQGPGSRGRTRAPRGITAQREKRNKKKTGGEGDGEEK